MFSGRSFDPRVEPVPWAYIDGVWNFHLRATATGGTRLVVRSVNHSGPHPLALLFGLLGEPLHFLIQRP